jgi:hypothetical protein
MVETIGMQGEVNGYADAFSQFVESHEANTAALLNLAEGKPKKDKRPAYDPNHSDNHWPLMIHHAQKGEKVIGQSLIGLTGRARDAREQANKKELDAHIEQGYRREPYLKPQIAVLDPATEKLQMLERNRQLEGMIIQQNDLLQKLMGRLEAIETKKG